MSPLSTLATDQLTLLSNLERDPEGYLVRPTDWNHEIALELAQEENIDLTAQYWPVIDFVRAHWEEHKITPDVRHVVDFLVPVLGVNKKQAKKVLFELFPYGYVKQACKIAGMQRPRGWSTG